MSFNIIYGDIRKNLKDAVVIPANPKSIIGHGVDKLIYDLAGKNLIYLERQNIGDLEIGEVAVTTAGELDSKIIIHAVSPAWDGGNNGEEELLRLCYERALQCAVDNGCKSVVFPLLSTGVLKFPKYKAKSIAVSTIEKFLESHDIDVTLVLYENKNEYKEILDRINRFIIENDYSNLDVDYYFQCEKNWANLPRDREEHQVLDLMRKQYARKLLDEKKRKIGASPYSDPFGFDMVAETHRYGYMSHINSIDDFIRTAPRRDSFSDVYNDLLRKKNMEDVNSSVICKKANIQDYVLTRLKKGTIKRNLRDFLWALSIALELDEMDVERLFKSCGQTTDGLFASNKKEDDREKCILYFISNGLYNIDKINDVLYKKGYEILGNASEQ